MLRLRREIAEVYVLQKLRVLLARQLEVVRREPVAEAARARVNLQEERAGLRRALKLYEVVPAAEAPQLFKAALGPALPAPRNPPRVFHGYAMALRAASVER